MKHFSNSLMFYSSSFLFFDRDEMYRNVFYTFIFLWTEISLTSKMFYFKNIPVSIRYILKHLISFESNGMLYFHFLIFWLKNALNFHFLIFRKRWDVSKCVFDFQVLTQHNLSHKQNVLFLRHPLSWSRRYAKKNRSSSKKLRVNPSVPCIIIRIFLRNPVFDWLSKNFNILSDESNLKPNVLFSSS